MDITFTINENSEYVDGEISYKNNEFIFESNNSKGEFSLMIGKGYCELSIARFNLKIYSFDGINMQEDWIKTNLIFPSSKRGELYVNDIVTGNNDGIWYTEDWNTYYDEKNNFICIGENKANFEDITIEFCKNIFAVIEKNKLKSIWIKNIIFRS